MGKDKASRKRKSIVEAIRKNALTARNTDSMIRRITVRDVATYGYEGVTLDDLKRVNFIYGGNGTGKTTLSRVLDAVNRLQIKDSSYRFQDVKFKDCEVEWTDGPVKVLVYNRDFRTRNLVENIPGVFTLGEGSVEAEKRLEALQKRLEEENQSLKSKQKRIDAREKQIRQDVARLRDTLWNEVLAPQEEYFGECLKTVVTSKAQFEREMRAKVESGEYRKALGRESLQERYRTLFRGERLVTMDTIDKPTDELTALTEIVENGIWEEVYSLETADKGGEVCPLCGQRIETEEQRRQHDRYKEAVETIRTLAEEYDEAAGRLKERLYGAMTYLQMGQGGTARHVEVMRMLVEMLKDRIETNRHIMANKLANPAMVAQFKDIAGTARSLWDIIDDTNKEIARHNETAAHHGPERERLSQDVMTYLAGRSASTVKYCQQAIAQKQVDRLTLEKEAEEILKRTKEMVLEIKELEKQLASTKPTVNRINHELKRYGFTGFSIQPTRKGTSYQIQREDGTFVKDTLSEGETTFITFLYYLQLVKGGETNSNVGERKVLVIDDPVSSLDNKVLGVVSEMVRQVINTANSEKIKVKSDINQIFVLTHNAEFYKKVTWVNVRSNKRREWHHWMLTKRGNESQIEAYGTENPVKMGYAHLWSELKEGVAQGRAVQNTMRNIVETYFVEFGGMDKNRMVEVYFAGDEEERTEMLALMDWMDQGSHGGEDTLFAETPREANVRNLERLRRLFVGMGQGAHYRMMMREVSL